MSISSNSNNTNKKISPFQSICTALAATVGTGNITGTALAISIGGPGSIFWMWVSALIGMFLIYFEAYLAVIYRYTTKSGNFVGGACAYIEKGAKLKPVAKIYAFFLMLAAIGMGGMTQSNSISYTLKLSFNVPFFITGIFVTLISFYIIRGGLSRLGKVVELLVPIMSVLYILACFIIIKQNSDYIIPSFRLILNDALTVKSTVGGFSGVLFSVCAKEGFSKGIFSSEAGLGTSSLAHSVSTSTSPKAQGCLAIFQVAFDTLIITTFSALVILTSPIYRSSSSCTASLTGLSLISNCFYLVLGELGVNILSICIALFAIATIIAWSYFGISAFKYFFGFSKDVSEKIFVMIFCASLFVGCISNVYIVWGYSEFINVFLLIINLACMLLIFLRRFFQKH